MVIHPRRNLAIALVIAAVVMITLSIVSAADAGYHLDQGRLTLPEQHQGHIYLHIIGDPPELGISVALAMLVAAGYFGTVRRSGGSTVAISTRYEVVQYERSGLFASDDVVLHLRSQRGLLSYEGGTNIACFIEDSSGAGPQWLFDHASLTAGDTVQVVAKDGTTWEVRFDPHTLRPTNPVDRCTNAPNPVGAD